MRLPILLALGIATCLASASARAERPTEKRESADIVLVAKVHAVYVRDTEGYKEYVVEMGVEEAEKGAESKKGETFRAFCYQRKAGKGGLEFDTAGHYAVPKEGQRIKAFMNRERGRNEGVYPDWFDTLPRNRR